MNCKPWLWKCTASTWRRHCNRCCFMRGESLEARKSTTAINNCLFQTESYLKLFDLLQQNPRTSSQTHQGQNAGPESCAPHSLVWTGSLCEWTPAANCWFIINTSKVNLGNWTHFCSHPYKYETSIQFNGSTELKHKLCALEMDKTRRTLSSPHNS